VAPSVPRLRYWERENLALHIFLGHAIFVEQGWKLSSLARQIVHITLRKIRCDGSKPTCGPCNQSSKEVGIGIDTFFILRLMLIIHQCTWGTVSTKRNTPHYIDVLEKRIDDLEETVDSLALKLVQHEETHHEPPGIPPSAGSTSHALFQSNNSDKSWDANNITPIVENLMKMMDQRVEQRVEQTLKTISNSFAFSSPTSGTSRSGQMAHDSGGPSGLYPSPISANEDSLRFSSSSHQLMQSAPSNPNISHGGVRGFGGVTGAQEVEQFSNIPDDSHLGNISFGRFRNEMLDPDDHAMSVPQSAPLPTTTENLRNPMQLESAQLPLELPLAMSQMMNENTTIHQQSWDRRHSA
jgi:hypothetical protein